MPSSATERLAPPPALDVVGGRRQSVGAPAGAEGGVQRVERDQVVDVGLVGQVERVQRVGDVVFGRQGDVDGEGLGRARRRGQLRQRCGGGDVLPSVDSW